MAHSYPRLIERFPAYRDQALKLRFQDKVFSELCRDYDRVTRALDAVTTESAGNSAPSNERQELLRLTRELEHEYLERLANQSLSKQERSQD